MIKILRFTTKVQWYYVQTKDMLADIGTRNGVVLEDINQDSVWVNGLPWMKLDKSEFSMSTSDEINLNESEFNEMRKEVEVHISNQFKIPNELRDRYVFSNYLIDPNQHTFNKVVCILAYVIRCCYRLLKIIKKIEEKKLISNQLSEEELKASETYFFKKGTQEIYQFIPPKKFEKFTTTKDDLLIYTGRILPEDQVTIVGCCTEAMKNLSQHSFCVPVLDKDSPVAYSITLDAHWNHPACKYSGAETTLRFIMKKIYIIEGCALVKLIRRCQGCRYLMKKTVEATIGPIPDCNLTVAPAFYMSQVDLSGPYSVYSPLPKCTTMKIWLAIFCCCSTSAVSIKIGIM